MATGSESAPVRRTPDSSGVAAQRQQGQEARSSQAQILTHPKAREALGILGIAVAIFLLASLLSYDPIDPSFFHAGGGPDQQVRNYGGR